MVRQHTYLQTMAVLLLCARSSCSEWDLKPANSKYLQRRSLTATHHGQGISMFDPEHWERRAVTVGTMAPSHRQLQDKATSNNPPEGSSDTRSLVTDTTNFPYNSIGIVRMLQETGPMGCSGALIHPNYVLTAAHCLYDPDSGSVPSSGDFTPGASMTNWFVPEDFISCGHNGYTSCHQSVDFGLIQIEGGYSDYLGFSWDASDDGGLVVNTAGYPVDKCLVTGGDVAFAGCSMYHASCTDQAIPSGAVVGQFPCYTFHGQSGSPVWLYNTSTGERFIRGILSSFAKSNTAGPGTFTLMSEVVFNSLMSWMQSSSK